MGRKEDIFKTVLTSAYDHNRFVDFIREIVTGVNVGPYAMELKPYNTFSAYISRYFQVGDFTDPEDNPVGVFSVELIRGESVERARTAQRSFVKTLLENGGYSAALVAFYAPGNDKWRFSFVRMDFEFAKGKIKETLTPARRYSYLVGKGEPCHTAMDRLLPIFMDDSKLPTIDEIEEAFSVEKVTKDFFEAYKEKYLQMAEFLEHNEDFVIESKHRGFTTEQFTKKLLSQIVFLYFIQKKGWLGVNAVPRTLTEKEYKNAFFSHGRKSRELVGKVYYQDGEVYRLNVKALQSLSDEDETEFSRCVKGQPWGTGPKDFMRRIFENAVKRGQNFFDDCLEPLFYTGLNQDRGENAFFPPLHCRIPFLNGGLFEELDHYDWKNNNFDIPNELFSNKDTKGRDADGILDIFDRYNFTMAEDEPLEKEVAVDPEMLGKVFENLLEVKDRKSKGAFYTPREIVHYMCSESLINYLVAKSGISEEDIRKFITLGEFFKDEDARRTKYNTETKKYQYDYEKQLEMPASILDFKNNVNRLDELDRLLASVRVVDPAVGSGAFPLGLLNEIVKARDTLTTYMAIPMNGFQRRMLYAQRSPYQLKTQTIKNCIFACDIEPSATDITKLRLWLALVIEDEIGDQDKDEFGEHTKPRKLPNLDCNVICGNSLNDTFEGIKLICNTEALGNAVLGSAVTITEQLIKGHINSLIELQDKLYGASSTEEKEEIKKQIQVQYDAIIMEQLQVNPDAMHKYSDPSIRHAASKSFVLWPLYFPRVFKDNGGFDICIGNPPYVNVEKMDNRDLIFQLFDTCVGRTDLYVAFLQKGTTLLAKGGTLSFIIPFAYTNQNYGQLSRQMLVENYYINEIVDTSNYLVFDTAMVKNIIIRFSNTCNEGHTKIRIVNSAEDFIAQRFNVSIIDQTLFRTVPGYCFRTNGFQNSIEIKQSINDCSIPLEELCLIAYGVRVNNKKDKNKPKSYYLIDTYEIGAKPFIEGRNIQRYFHEQNGWLRYCPDEHYNPMFPELFENEKIIFIRVVSERLRFSYDNENLYNSHTVLNCVRLDKIKNATHSSAKKACKKCSDYDFVSSYDVKFLLGILNSNLINWYFKTFVSDGINFYPENAKQLPIIDIRKKEVEQSQIVQLVDKVIAGKKVGEDTSSIEKEIDRIIYELYGLSEDQILIVEEHNERL